MGGMGSGKDTVSQMRGLDVRKWKRDGYLEPGRSGTWTWSRRGEVVATINFRVEAGRVVLSYRTRERGGEWRNMELPVRLDWTACHFGGNRAWFRCPRCNRRVAMLYGGGVFACRHCHQLAYDCQRETAGDRATRQADKLRERLGWEAGILNGNGWKPKWMRWRTFERLSAKHDALVGCSLAEMQAKLSAMCPADARLLDRWKP